MPNDDEKIESLGCGIRIITTKNHKFGMDAVLLSNYVRIKKNSKVCELGTGNGIIPLLWCREYRNFKVDAIEIQQEAAKIAKRSVENSGLADIINIINDDFITTTALGSESYDIVVCNPPYKKTGTGPLSESESSRIANHEHHTTLEDVIRTASRLLKYGGSFYLCHRPERLADIFDIMRQNRIEPKRLKLVQQRANTKAMLLLCEGKKQGKPGLLTDPVLIVEDNSEYSAAMKEIYLKFK
jgi:tRNA1Val (adenine37-N6)-methyltransferase